MIIIFTSLFLRRSARCRVGSDLRLIFSWSLLLSWPSNVLTSWVVRSVRREILSQVPSAWYELLQVIFMKGTSDLVSVGLFQCKRCWMSTLITSDSKRSSPPFFHFAPAFLMKHCQDRGVGKVEPGPELFFLVPAPAQLSAYANHEFKIIPTPAQLSEYANHGLKN